MTTRGHHVMFQTFPEFFPRGSTQALFIEGHCPAKDYL